MNIYICTHQPPELNSAPPNVICLFQFSRSLDQIHRFQIEWEGKQTNNFTVVSEWSLIILLGWFHDLIQVVSWMKVWTPKKGKDLSVGLCSHWPSLFHHQFMHRIRSESTKPNRSNSWGAWMIFVNVIQSTAFLCGVNVLIHVWDPFYLFWVNLASLSSGVAVLEDDLSKLPWAVPLFWI